MKALRVASASSPPTQTRNAVGGKEHMAIGPAPTLHCLDQEGERMDAERQQRLTVLLQRHRGFLMRQLAAATSMNGSLAMRREPGSTAAHGRTSLEKVDAALARLAAGSYGICTRCGREIALDRLDLVPASAYCLRCARHRSRGHKGGVTHFAAALAKFYRRYIGNGGDMVIPRDARTRESWRRPVARMDKNRSASATYE